MKYTPEVTTKLVADYQSGVSTEELAAQLDVPVRSVIAKLSSLGVYQKKSYLNKRGEVPIKKEEYIDRLAVLLNVNIDRLESLEKVNKNVLKLLEDALTADKWKKPPNCEIWWLLCVLGAITSTRHAPLVLSAFYEKLLAFAQMLSY